MTTMTTLPVTKTENQDTPNFHVQFRGRMLLAFAALSVPAAAALYAYGQFAPGV